MVADKSHSSQLLQSEFVAQVFTVEALSLMSAGAKQAELLSPAVPMYPVKHAPQVSCTLAHPRRCKAVQSGALAQLTEFNAAAPTEMALFVAVASPELLERRDKMLLCRATALVCLVTVTTAVVLLVASKLSNTTTTVCTWFCAAAVPAGRLAVVLLAKDLPCRD